MCVLKFKLVGLRYLTGDMLSRGWLHVCMMKVDLMGVFALVICKTWHLPRLNSMSPCVKSREF